MNGMDILDAAQLRNSGDIKDDIYHILKKLIMQRAFTPNERLDANKISEKLGVSRTPVRDALNMLDAEGFVQTFPRKGIVVTGIYKEDLIELFQYREMIELFALDHGFARLTTSVGELEAALRDWNEHVQQDEFDGVAIMESDVQFHKLIVKSAQNYKIMKSYEALNCHVQTARGYYLQDRDRIDQADAEHRAVLAMIADGNKEGASRLLKEHLHSTLANLIKTIEVFKVF